MERNPLIRMENIIGRPKMIENINPSWISAIAVSIMAIIGAIIGIVKLDIPVYIRRRRIKEKNTHGFFIKEAAIEVRFSDWRESSHNEVFERYTKVMPLRSGSLQIDNLIGSSSRKDIDIQSTHKPDICREDAYHMRQGITVPDAEKAKPIEILQKSIRYDVLNNPEMIGIRANLSEEDKNKVLKYI